MDLHVKVSGICRTLESKKFLFWPANSVSKFWLVFTIALLYKNEIAFPLTHNVLHLTNLDMSELNFFRWKYNRYQPKLILVLPHVISDSEQSHKNGKSYRWHSSTFKITAAPCSFWVLLQHSPVVISMTSFQLSSKVCVIF